MTQQATQQGLDAVQYATESILHYEAVFGKDFVSPGGYEMAFELIAKMNLAPGMKVLDVGCGLGGSAFVMAREFGLQVDGIDLSKNMLAIANEKLSNYGLTTQVRLKYGDCLDLDQSDYYDAVYSRDVFLHIHDKARLFERLKNSLRSGGTLLFTDYCCGEKPWSDDFTAYVTERGYCLHTLPDYAELIKAAGFQRVDYQDLTDRFITILQSDLLRIVNLDMVEAERAALEQSWRSKLARALSGDHRWGVFSAIAA